MNAAELRIGQHFWKHYLCCRKPASLCIKNNVSYLILPWITQLTRGLIAWIKLKQNVFQDTSFVADSAIVDQSWPNGLQFLAIVSILYHRSPKKLLSWGKHQMNGCVSIQSFWRKCQNMVWYRWALDFSGPPFTNMVLTLFPAWISNHTSSKVLDEITYPFLNFNGATVEVKEWISNFFPHIIMDALTYPWWD